MIEVLVRRREEMVSMLIDETDWEGFRELYPKRSISIGSHGYVQYWQPVRKVRLLHRWILGLQPGDGLIGDHINGDKLDNRLVNLRIVDPSGSSQNVAGRGASVHRGVYLNRHGRWYAKVKFRGNTYNLGTFESETEAARVADAKRRELMPFYVPPAQRIPHSELRAMQREGSS
jgi:hypothetical protein